MGRRPPACHQDADFSIGVISEQRFHLLGCPTWLGPRSDYVSVQTVHTPSGVLLLRTQVRKCLFASLPQCFGVHPGVETLGCVLTPWLMF